MRIRTFIYTLLLLPTLMLAAASANAQGYDPDEVATLKAFFSQTAADGVRTNGAMLGVANIEKWDPGTQLAKIQWNSMNPKRVMTLQWSNKGLAGDLNVSGFKYIQQVAVAWDTTVVASERGPKSQLTSLTLSDSLKYLTDIRCNDNLITSLILPDSLKDLARLDCQNNQLRTLTMPSVLGKLTTLNCSHNLIESLILPAEINTIKNKRAGLDSCASEILCANNRLKFSTLPKVVFCTGFTKTSRCNVEKDFVYSPQAIIQGYKVHQGAGIDLSSEFDITVRGEVEPTTYAWFEVVLGNENPIALPSLGSGIFDVTGKAGKTLRCKMTNANYANLVLVYETLVVNDNEPVYDYNGEIADLKVFFAQKSADGVTTNGSKLGIFNVDSWDPSMTGVTDGLTWTPGSVYRLNTISWNGKGLAGQLDLANCTQVTSVDVSNNEIGQITAPSTYTLLSTFTVGNNAMKISTLPAIASSVAGFTYTPQDTIFAGTTYETVDLSGESSVTINSTPYPTTYAWFNITSGGEVPVTTGIINNGQGVFTLQDYTLSGATLLCKLTNSGFPKLDTEGKPIVYKYSVGRLANYNSLDVSALKSFFRQTSATSGVTNGAKLGVTDIDDWEPDTPGEDAFLTWDGSSPRRLSEIVWSNKGLAGTLALTNCDSIVVLACDSNYISTITLPANAAITSLSVQVNKLKFSTLPKYAVGGVLTTYTYAPQDSIIAGTIPYTTSINLGAEASVTIGSSTVASTFSWFKISNDVATPITPSGSNGIFRFSVDNIGDTVICKITNASFPDLRGDSSLIYKAIIAPAPGYDPYEVEVLRAFFALPNADGVGINGDEFGIFDADAWDPSTTSAGLSWSEGSNKHVTAINFTLKTLLTGRLDLSIFSYLKRLEINRTKITALTLPVEADSLANVFCQEAALTALATPTNAPKLEVLNCYTNKIGAFSFPSYAPVLKEVRIDANQLTEIIVPDHIRALTLLWARENQLTKVKLHGNLPALRYLYLTRNPLDTIVLPSLPGLQSLWLDHNKFRFSTLPKIKLPTSSAYTTGNYRYLNQDTIQGGTVSGTITDLVNEYIITRNGETRATQYTWYEIDTAGNKIGENINGFNVDAATGIIVIPSSAVGKKVRCEMRNATFPGGEFAITEVDYTPLTLVYEATVGAALLSEVKVNGQVASLSRANTYAYMADCNVSQITMSLTAMAGANVKVNGQTYNPATVILLTPEAVTPVEISVTTADNIVTEYYVLNVASALPGNKFFKQRWNDVLSAVNNPNNNGGFTFNSYKWYKNGILVDENTNGYYYEQGGLDRSATYSAIFQSRRGDEYKVCPLSAVAGITSVKIYPTPIHAGQSITVQLPEGDEEGSVQILNINGNYVKRDMKLDSNTGYVTAPAQPGMYLLQVKPSNKTPEYIKIIVD